MGGFFLTIKNNKTMSVTQEQINEWKEKHGGVYALPVEDKTGYLREPNMNDYKRAFSAMQKNGDIAFGEELLSALWLGGDEAIKTQDEYFLTAKKVLIDFFNYPDAIINNIAKGKTEILIGDERCVIRVITREDLKLSEKRNPTGKPFVTQEALFNMVCEDKTEGFEDVKRAEIRFPLYQAIESLQNKKIGQLKKL
ncbi:hypothetical protein [Chryseobacterium herbae]|uniref:MmgE/PrpD family protein n=1 Tax=Chryseobacterium herbae TaxID=2976476 RepID=A0ABT2IYM5_9FLAO|nr:hypothetical protein [Chryseobacterium sp. pc1-10]MCT2563949.1 hypothetical protein [Chryseobacterium sp. pc1-10]